MLPSVSFTASYPTAEVCMYKSYFEGLKAHYLDKPEPVIESLTPSAWKYGRFIRKNGPCLKFWNEFTNAVQLCLPPTHLGTNSSMFAFSKKKKKNQDELSCCCPANSLFT